MDQKAVCGHGDSRFNQHQSKGYKKTESSGSGVLLPDFG